MRVPAQRWTRNACSGILEVPQDKIIMWTCNIPLPHSSAHSSVGIQGFFPAALIHSAGQASPSVHSRVVDYLESTIGSSVARMVGSKI